MKAPVVAILTIFWCTSCSDQTTDESLTSDDPVPELEEGKVEIAYPEHFKGAWVMSSAWAFYMGVAIALTEDRYFYWMYSDVVGAKDYPYTGSYSVEDGVLYLREPMSMATETAAKRRLYSDEWRILAAGRTTCLLAISNTMEQTDRLLIPDVQFNPETPFSNQYLLKPHDRSELRERAVLRERSGRRPHVRPEVPPGVHPKL